MIPTPQSAVGDHGVLTAQGRRTRRILLALGALVVGANLMVWIGSLLGPQGAVSGPTGSSYVTTSDGSAALAGMLERLGAAIERARRPLDEVTLEGTLVIVDAGAAEYGADELNAIDRFLGDGGTLVVAGQSDMMDRLLSDAPEWRSAGADIALPTGSLGGIAGLDEVRLSGFGSLLLAEPDEAVLTSGELVLAARRPIGSGTLWWLADSGPVHNGLIGASDAAVFAAALVDPGAPVIFDEYRHGYRDDAGFWDLLPERWRTTLVLAGVVIVIGLVAYGRRFGPPHDTRRSLPPGRETYLSAVAGILERSGAVNDALDTIRTEAERQLQRRGHDLAEGARVAGLSPIEIESLSGAQASPETLGDAASALAKLNQERQ